MPRARSLPAPRWQTPLPPDVVGSWGPDVAEHARRELGIILDRWQRRALNRALAYRHATADELARGLGPFVLVHRLYLISTARQQGKTALVRALIGWALTAGVVPPWATIAGLAHQKAQARIPYRAVLADLAPVRKRVGPLARGGLALTQYLGIRSAMYGLHREYHYWSRDARDALRGESVDLALFDEVRTQRDFETWSALEPTTTARPDPLILAISTAGTDRSVLLRDWWERGLRIIDGAEPAEGFGMTWYAAPDELAPDDRRGWLAAAPAVAEGRLSVAPIAASYRALGPAQFRSERLNLWSDAVDEWLAAGVWAAGNAPQPNAVDGRVVFGVDVVPSWRHASIAVGLPTESGAWVGLAGELDVTRGDDLGATVSPASLIALLDELAPVWRPAVIAYASTSAAGAHVERWAEDHEVRTRPLNSRDVRSASELFRSELVAGRLTHADDRLLARQSRDARPSGELESGDWYLSVKQSVGYIDAIRATAWAGFLAIAPGEREVDDGVHV